MSFTVFLGNLPTWVTADDIMGWLSAESLVADAIKVIRNPETQESKGFAFIEAPNTDEMNSIIRRFDRAPLEDRLLRANPAQPPRPKGEIVPGGRPPQGAEQRRPYSSGPPRTAQPSAQTSAPPADRAQQQTSAAAAPPATEQRPPRRGKKSVGGGRRNDGPQSPFAEELTNALN
ncbi:MAG: RNA-binding protein [Acidobacteriota bacterium]